MRRGCSRKRRLKRRLKSCRVSETRAVTHCLTGNQNPALTRQGFVFLLRYSCPILTNIGSPLADMSRRPDPLSVGSTALRLFIVRTASHCATTDPIGGIDSMPNPAMERRPRPIDRRTNKPMLHRIGVQGVHVLPVVSFIPNDIPPETVLHNVPNCLAVWRLSGALVEDSRDRMRA